MRTIPTLLIPAILLSIHQTALAQTKGAVAIEDCVALESSMSAKAPSKKQIQIKAGEVFSFHNGRSVLAGKADGLVQMMYFKDPAGVSSGVAAWVPEKSILLFDAGRIGDPSEDFSAGKLFMMHKWKDEFVAKAKKAAPEDVQAKMGWADPFIKRYEERGSSFAAARPTTAAAARPAAQQTTDTAKSAPLTGGPGMYLINFRSEVWKDDKIQGFRPGSSNAVFDIFVTDEALYVAGFVGGQGPTQPDERGTYGLAAYWKNGELHQLEETVVSAATAIYVSGDDVYVAGTRGGGEARRPVLWKNGKVQDLSDKRGTAAWTPTAIYAKGSDITIVGSINGFAWETARLYGWKNGVEINPMPNLKVSRTNNRGQRIEGELSASEMSIAVSNGDVYVGGLMDRGKSTEALRAWKNGQPITRATVEVNFSVNEELSFYVSDNDVFFYTGTKLWKNGTPIKLETFENPNTLQQMPHRIRSVFASGNDVYVLGRISGKEGIVLWKNGKAEFLNLKSNSTSGFFPERLIIKN